MDITCITASSSSSSSSAPFSRGDSSDSTSVLTPVTLRRPPYPITSKLHDQLYFTYHLHERQLTLMECTVGESDITDHLLTEPTVSGKPAASPGPLLPSKGAIGPHVTNLPRRRTRTEGARPDRRCEDVVDLTPQPVPTLLKRAQLDECRCLQELVPGLFVAFEDDRLAFGDAAAGGSGERLKTYKGEDFTHIVSLSTESAAAAAAMVRAAGAGSRLQLVIPAAQDAPDDEDDNNVHPQLSQSQLRAARNFLLSSNLRLSPAAYSQSADVRILITTPRSHRVDAMAIASCYLSSASGLSVRRVLAHFDDGNRYLSVWQGIMDWQAWDFVEGVARN